MVRFDELGGTLTVNGVMVHATVSWAEPLRVGGRYVIFALSREPGKRICDATSIYELNEPAGIRRVSPTAETDEIENWLTREDLTRAISESLSRGR